VAHERLTPLASATRSTADTGSLAALPPSQRR
jgi:hypothetical protein